jgi:hypothetical protein
LPTVYDAISSALTAQLAELYPQADHPVENAEYAAMIAEYVAARAASAKIAGRAQESYSAVGVSFNFRNAAGAARAAAGLRVQLARAGFSIDAGTPEIADIRGIHEPVS